MSIYSNEIEVSYHPRHRRSRRAEIAHVLDTFADLIWSRARELVPVETGDLKESIDVQVDDGTIVLRAGEGLEDDRARFQEFGFVHYQTGHFIINPYGRPAVEEYKRPLREAIRNALVGRSW